MQNQIENKEIGRVISTEGKKKKKALFGQEFSRKDTALLVIRKHSIKFKSCRSRTALCTKLQVYILLKEVGIFG